MKKKAMFYFKITPAFAMINWLTCMYDWKLIWLCLIGDVLLNYFTRNRS